MLKTTTGILMAIALLFIMSAPHLWGLEAAAQGGCDANAKVANLDFTLKDINGKNVILSAYKGKGSPPRNSSSAKSSRCSSELTF
ncbi:MAG: hypothetical protein HY646_10765 [Acidobacteria bacterium]|nr:hypothetical protein [Acidobacteriota bacterium]